MISGLHSGCSFSHKYFILWMKFQIYAIAITIECISYAH